MEKVNINASCARIDSVKGACAYVGASNFAIARAPPRHDLRSHVCWHVYGLLYRQDLVFSQGGPGGHTSVQVPARNVPTISESHPVFKPSIQQAGHQQIGRTTVRHLTLRADSGYTQKHAPGNRRRSGAASQASLPTKLDGCDPRTGTTRKP